MIKFLFLEFNRFELLDAENIEKMLNVLKHFQIALLLDLNFH